MKYKIFMQAYDQYVIILLTDFTWITIKQSCTLFLQVVELHSTFYGSIQLYVEGVFHFHNH